MERRSSSRASRWRAASRCASLSSPSGAQCSTRAPNLRAWPSTCRSQNERSSPTSTCEPCLLQLRRSVSQSRRHPSSSFLRRNVNGVKYVGSVKEKTLARKLYAQARSEDKAAGIVRCWTGALVNSPTQLHSNTSKEFFCLTGPIPRNCTSSSRRSTFPPAATLTLSFTTRR